MAELFFRTGNTQIDEYLQDDECNLRDKKNQEIGTAVKCVHELSPRAFVMAGHAEKNQDAQHNGNGLP